MCVARFYYSLNNIMECIFLYNRKEKIAGLVFRTFEWYHITLYYPRYSADLVN